MKLQNIVYATDMARAVAFYESLGLVRGGTGAPDAHWNEFAVGDAKLALHLGSELPDYTQRVDLFLVLPVDGSLDRLQGSVEGASEIRELGFGRFFTAKDPDGFPVWVSESAG